MLRCCCQENDGTSVELLDAIPALKGAEEQGLVGIGSWQDSSHSTKSLPPDDVLRLTVHVGEHDELGIPLDTSGVTAIHLASQPAPGTAVSKATAKAGNDRGLTEGDYVVSLNGVSGDVGQMIEEVLGCSRFEILVSPPVVFTIMVSKMDCSLGCIISYDKDSGRSLAIEGVRPTRRCRSC
uniref:PDZ domain-containing protein n=1 Tax=Alexandrium andersonii TaxID=327968 RepID=A0A7S2AGV6_9DINO|mmetsp:Transcript_12005/g.27228  ORF Transcript_12005/g.27228 Transcript_12005/m.27228 type:complete len:181 (+) Transcript_12005:110-652(+)